MRAMRPSWPSSCCLHLTELAAAVSAALIVIVLVPPQTRGTCGG